MFHFVPHDALLSGPAGIPGRAVPSRPLRNEEPAGGERAGPATRHVEAPARRHAGSVSLRQIAVGEPGTATWLRDVRVALVPWMLARLVVGATLALARFSATSVGARPRPVPLGQGLFAWDAAWYRAIAEHGYHGADGSLRFFPLVPLLTRAVGWVTGDAAALLLVVNVAALVLAVLLGRLTRLETGDEAAVDRAMWLVALAPPAAVLVLGYAEAVFMALSVGAYLCLRRRRWWGAAAAGYLAGLTRPFGAVLGAAAAIEAARGWKAAGARDRIARLASVVAPVAGTGTYLAWVGVRYGDWLEPLHLQQRRIARGGVQDPVASLSHSASALVGTHHVGTGLHFVSAVLFLALLVLVARRLPASATAFAAAGVALVLSAHNLDSMERYCFSLFPFVLVTAIVTRRELVARTVFVACGAGLVAYSLLLFFGAYVP